jgi:hypothetical protein
MRAGRERPLGLRPLPLILEEKRSILMIINAKCLVCLYIKSKVLVHNPDGKSVRSYYCEKDLFAECNDTNGDCSKFMERKSNEDVNAEAKVSGARFDSEMGTAPGAKISSCSFDGEGVEILSCEDVKQIRELLGQMSDDMRTKFVESLIQSSPSTDTPPSFGVDDSFNVCAMVLQNLIMPSGKRVHSLITPKQIVRSMINEMKQLILSS